MLYFIMSMKVSVDVHELSRCFIGSYLDHDIPVRMSRTLFFSTALIPLTYWNPKRETRWYEGYASINKWPSEYTLDRLKCSPVYSLKVGHNVSEWPLSDHWLTLQNQTNEKVYEIGNYMYIGSLTHFLLHVLYSLCFCWLLYISRCYCTYIYDCCTSPRNTEIF